MSPSFFALSCQDFEHYLIKSKPKIPSFHPHFEVAFWEMMLNGGKRFRPALALSVVCALSPEMTRNAFDVCLALECLHTYSLIHDDLPSMDNATLRRGNPTLHCKYGETSAILVGDGLNTYSFYLLAISKFAPDVKVALIESLSKNGGINGMVLGQGLDCAFENIRLEQEQVDFIHTHKTAKLIAASLQMGGIMCNVEAKVLHRLYDFGLRVGLFFQIRDDIIDFKQDSQKSGKNANNDTAKNSYVNLLGIHKAQSAIEKATATLKSELDSIYSISAKLGENLDELLGEYFRSV